MTIYLICDKDGNPVGIDKYKITYAFLDMKTAKDHCDDKDIIVPFKSKKG